MDFTEELVKEEEFDLGNDKTPSPNGYGFLRALLEGTRKDVLELVKISTCICIYSNY